MKQKTTKEIKKIVKEIYGNKYVLTSMKETRCRETSEMLWDYLRFQVKASKKELVISFVPHENIGYTTNEYNELGDTPNDCTNWNLLDKALEVKQ